MRNNNDSIAASIMPLFTNKKPIVAASEIQEFLNISYYKTRIILNDIEKMGVIKQAKISGKNVACMPCHEFEFESFKWPESIINERNAWMKKATQFYKILSKNDMGVLA